MAPDPASSGRWFDGWRLGDRAGGRAPETFGLALEVPGSGAVARPHSWLLRVGWLRRGGGRIDPDDVPGT
jgi:hypothetical protein